MVIGENERKIILWLIIAFVVYKLFTETMEGFAYSCDCEADLQEEISSIRDDIDQLRKTRKDARSSRCMLEPELDDLQDDMDDLDDRRQTITADIESNLERKDSEDQIIDNSKQQIIGMQEDLNVAQTEIMGYQEEMDQLNHMFIPTVTSELNESSEKMNKLQTCKNICGNYKKLSKNKQKSVKKKADKNDCNCNKDYALLIETQQGVVSEFEEQLGAYNSSMEDMVQNINNINSDVINSTQEDIVAQEDLINNAQAVIGEIQPYIDDMEAQYADVNSQWETVSDQLGSTQSNFDAALESIQKSSDEIKDLKNTLKDARACDRGCK